MKTFKSFICIVACLLGISPIHAQFKVTSDGGIKMGTQRKSGSITMPWSLTNRGLEVNIGDIVFYASNGAKLSFTSYTSKSKASPIDPGFPGLNPSPIVYSILTGSGLQVGSSENLIWELNTTYSYSKYPTESGSDRRMKRNILPIVDAKQYILNLQPVTYDMIPEEDFIGDSTKLLNKAGFIAQDVLEVLPGAVGYMEEVDRYTLNYSHFIPYLTQTIQEQEQEIQALQDQLASLQEIVQSLLQNENVNTTPKGNVPKNSPENTIQEAKLFQNLPNPFSETTVIRYELPKTAGNAYLQVFDMSGRMLRNIALPHAQEIGQVEISAGELTPGAYTYSLVVSGKVVDSRRMVVTQ